MEIATHCRESLHDRLSAVLADRGFTEVIGRYDALTAEEQREVRVLFGWDITQEVVDSCPNLEWIQGAGAGMDWLMPVQLPAQVVVTRIVDQFGPDMAEYALMGVLAWVKNWGRLYRQQQQKEWQQYLVGMMTPLRVGLLGAGSIGAHIAEVFRPLVKEVRAMGRRRPDLAGVRGYSGDDWRAFYHGLDVLVIVLPHTPDTYHLVGKEALDLMNRGGFLVNVGRGAVLDQEALAEALRSGQLSGAQLDVFEQEPLPADSELWDLPGLAISPHISGPSRVEGMAEVFLDNLTRFRQGRPLVGQINRAWGY